MLTRYALLLLLLLGLSHGFDYKIELDRCNVDTDCYVRESCVPVGKRALPGRDNTLEFVKSASDVNVNCDVIVQTTYISDKKTHIRIQVKSDTAPIENGAIAETVSAHPGRKRLYGCINGEPSGSSDYKTTKLGAQINEKNLVFCSFLALETRKPPGSIPSIEFKTATEETLLYGPARGSTNSAHCDSENIDSSETADSDYLLRELDTTRTQLSCSTGVLRIHRTGHPLIYPAEMKCEKEQGKYKWIATDSVGLETKIEPNEKFQAHCQAKFCSLCDPKEMDSNCPGCTTPKLVSKEGCSILECPAKKWRKEGVVVDGKVECKKESADSLKSAWFFGNQVVNKMGCSEKFDCVEFNNIQLDESMKISESKNLSCSDTSLVLKYSDSIFSPILTCDESTGLFTDGKNIIPKGGSITCEKVTSAQNGGNTVVYASIGVVSALLLIAGIIAVVVFMRKRRNAPEIKQEPTKEAAKSKDAPSSGAPSPTASPSGGVPSSN